MGWSGNACRCHCQAEACGPTTMAHPISRQRPHEQHNGSGDGHDLLHLWAGRATPVDVTVKRRHVDLQLWHTQSPGSDRMSSIMDPVTGTTSYTYGLVGQRLSMSLSSGGMWTYNYGTPNLTAATA